ncbi:MAG TPA: TonB-dependent receptor [Acidobacteriaceae bacterium]|jgi:hypothetical protein
MSIKRIGKPSRLWTILSAVVFCLVALQTRAGAQSSSAAVTGTVTDASGAKLPGAKLVLTNVDTNVARSTVSNGSGGYSFVEVPPARYTLTITAPSFQRQNIQAFDVVVAQAVDVNVTMRVGSTTETVTVDAIGTQVESSTAQLGTVIGTEQVNNLPLNGRNFTQLLMLTPGASPVNVGQNSSSSNTANYPGDQYIIPSVNGQGSRSNLFLVDGLNDNNSWYNTYSVPPIIDTIQEFKINTHNDAQYGQVTGGVINIISKSGTNALHGSAWEFVRNNAFDSSTYFPSAGSAYRQNMFGAQTGGPIMIPKLYNGRGKTFFEVGFEGFHYTKASQAYYLQPTAAQLGESAWGGPQNLTSGDFSPASTGCAIGNASSLQTSKCQLYDPTGNHNATSNRPYYANNQIPVSEMDPHAVAFINAVFGPPVTIPGIAPTVDNGILPTPTHNDTYNYTGRIDQHIGSRDFLFFRYGGWQSYSSSPSAVPHLFSSSQLLAQQYGGTWSHIFTPTLTLQLQYGRNHVEYDTTTSFNVPNIALAVYGMDPSYSQGFVGNVTLLTNLAVTGGFSGGEVNTPSPDEDNTHEYQGTVIAVLGRHTIQAGGGWDQVNYGQLIRQGQISFTGASTSNFLVGGAPQPGSPASLTAAQAGAQTGNGLVDFLLDEPNNANKRNVHVTMRVGGIGSAYVQDSWKVTPKLTANIGIRYDRPVWPQYGAWSSVGNQGSIETGDWDFNTGNYILQVAPPTCASRGHAPCLPSATLPAHVIVSQNGNIMHGSKMNFGPRLGLAYRISDKLSVRGGFGITYDDWSGITQIAQNFQGSWPDIGTLALNSLNTPGSQTYTPAQNPFGSSTGIFPVANPYSTVNYFVDPRTRNPYSEQWNVGFERQIDRFTVFSLNYVGSQSHRLDIGGYYNTGTLSTTSFTTRQNQYNANPSAYSNGAGNNPTGQLFPYAIPNKWDHAAGSGSYNALQASLTRRLGDGLAYNAAYTWSKAIDEGMSELFYAGTGASLEDPYNPRGSRSVAGFNVPQQLTLGLTYDIPVGKGRKFSTGHGVADYVLGNWELGTIYVLRSGQNFSVTSAGDIGNTGNGNTYERANIVGDPYTAGAVASNPSCSAPSSVRNAAHWFNPCAFVTPNQGTLGNSGRNMLQAQTYNDVDASVTRSFPIWEALSLRLRVDAFNVLNHPTLGLPAAATTTSTTIGTVSSVATNTNQRLLQFSAKLQF